ncbi:MAG TPA: VOC family protein [Terriglobales bacterium]|nr:VOC family protein [Terriglobales bacterium]
MYSLRQARTLLALCALLQPAAIASSNDQIKRPRITGIDHVTVYVSDVARSRDFYSAKLGLTLGCPEYRGPDTCYLVRPGQRILLKQAPAQQGGLKNWIAEIGFATDDLMRMRSYLLAHGRVSGPILTQSDGAREFRVRDAEGNLIAFVQRTPLQASYEAAPKQIGSRLIHAGFVVRDKDAENRFYVDLLGFRLYWYGGFKDKDTDWYELQVPNGPDWIEYMLNIPADADHKELGIQNHFSLGVKNVNDAARQLRGNGLQTFDGPEIGRDGKDSLDAYDPDGTRVEVMEFTPKQKPCCHPYTAEHPKP